MTHDTFIVYFINSGNMVSANGVLHLGGELDNITYRTISVLQSPISEFLALLFFLNNVTMVHHKAKIFRSDSWLLRIVLIGLLYLSDFLCYNWFVSYLHF